jgi:hypothetical protein
VGRPVPLQKWSTVDPADLLSEGGLSEAAEKSWHRLDGHKQLPKTILRSKLAAAGSNASVRCRKIRLLPDRFPQQSTRHRRVPTTSAIPH